MARHKDTNWNLPDGRPVGGGHVQHSWEAIHTALLMDIRDEMRLINSKLGCYRIPRTMDAIGRIDRRLAKKITLK